MSKYRIDTWDHHTAPKGGKRFQLMQEGATRRVAHGVIYADGRPAITAGFLPDADAKKALAAAAAKVAEDAAPAKTEPPPSEEPKSEAEPLPTRAKLHRMTTAELEAEAARRQVDLDDASTNDERADAIADALDLS